MAGVDHDALVDAALPAGALAAFVVSAVTASVAGRWLDEIVLVILVLDVAAVGFIAGRLPAALTAATAALSFDFFRVEPIRTLHLVTLAAVLAGLGAVAVATGSRSGEPERSRRA